MKKLRDTGPDSQRIILQITDMHLGAAPGERLAGWDTWAAFTTVLETVDASEPADAIVLLTGDLVQHAEPTAYQRLRSLLDRTGRRWYAVPGNHDDPQAMREHLGCAGWPVSLPLGRSRLILLDSHLPGCDGGRLDEATLDWLAHTLEQAPDQSTLLALHHPPVSVGSAWIDALGLENGAALLQRCSGHSALAGIVCGHVHQAFDRQINGCRVICTPSTQRQFAVGSDEFKTDNAQPPVYRKLVLHDDQRLITRLCPVNAARGFGPGKNDGRQT